MITSRDQLDAGHAVYTKSLLRLYDLGVLGLSARLIWRCPAARILDLYQRYATSNHLDVGFGGVITDHTPALRVAHGLGPTLA